MHSKIEDQKSGSGCPVPAKKKFFSKVSEASELFMIKVLVSEQQCAFTRGNQSNNGVSYAVSSVDYYIHSALSPLRRSRKIALEN